MNETRRHEPLSEVLQMWTVFESPSDFPGSYVVRRWRILDGKAVPDLEPWHVGGTLEGARRSVPFGLYNIGRQPEDDLPIVETWI